jgi:hypothetical protein
MYCPKCGAKTELTDSNFCYKCGFDLRQIPEKANIETKRVVSSSEKVIQEVKGEMRPSGITPSKTLRVKKSRIRTFFFIAAISMSILIVALVILVMVSPTLFNRLIGPSQEELATQYMSRSLRENRGAIINDLNNLAAQAYQFKIRPMSTGGGQGLYSGFTVPLRMQTTENATYSAQVLDEARVQFIAISAKGFGTISTILDWQGKLGSWDYSGFRTTAELIAGSEESDAGETSDRASSSTSTSTKKIYSRSELKNLVEGKTDTQVIQALGRPQSTIEYGEEAGTSLIYNGITKDPYTDKIDRMAIIQVKHGTVAYVTFNN